ncbi:MAG: beta-galactosidase trimerization domain-containing protein, partial [Actinomycetota bacterium]
LLLDRVDGPVLERYAALIVPDHEPIPDDVAATIDRFVDEGGMLVATGRTGWRDGEMEPRPAPALACLGIERVRAVRDDVRGAYLEVGDHAGFPRLAGTDLVFLDGVYVEAEYRPGAERRLRLIPPGPFGPPERCVLPAATDEPGLVIHPFGAGRVLYLPWSCGALVDRHGQTNTSSFAADVLQHHAGLEPVGGNLSPMVEVTLLERREERVHLLHLVNASGAWAGTRPVPMRDLEVVIPFSGEPTDVGGLVTGGALGWHATGDSLTIRVPELDLFEAIRIEGG